MAGEYKQCPNGHFYPSTDVSCRYCKTSSGNARNNASVKKTEAFFGSDGINRMPTEMQDDGGEIKTTVIDEQEMLVENSGRNISPASRTVFVDKQEIDVTTTGKQVEKTTYRNRRKIVGWLVTYTFDEMGVDYKLYEGRNIIGRDTDCNITVNDGMMSGKHATLLFRGDKYSLTDSQSSHGTFVNDKDIDLEPCNLKDGDMIRMGKTIFKFRTSL